MIVAGFVLAVALGAAGGFAAAEALSEDDDPEAVVAEATVEPDDASEPLTKALEFLVDEAVDAGRLTEDEGERLKERLQSSELPLVVPGLERLPFGDRGFDLFERGFGLLGGILDLDTAASYLGLTESELREELEDGKSLAEIAREQDKSVDGLVEELVDAAERRIDDAVADGRLAEDRATRLKDGLEERIRNRVDDELRWRGFPFDFPRGMRGPKG
jgi:polyhydroxyalkanoate synthesis regulator phasin